MNPARAGKLRLGGRRPGKVSRGSSPSHPSRDGLGEAGAPPALARPATLAGGRAGAGAGTTWEGPPARPGSRGSYRLARTARRAARRPTSAPCHPRPGQRPRPATPAPARPVPSRAGRRVTWPQSLALQGRGGERQAGRGSPRGGGGLCPRPARGAQEGAGWRVRARRGWDRGWDRGTGEEGSLSWWGSSVPSYPSPGPEGSGSGTVSPGHRNVSAPVTRTGPVETGWGEVTRKEWVP